MTPDATAQAPVPRWRERAIDLLAAALSLVGLGWALDVPRMVGLLLYNEQLIAAMLGLRLLIVFLRMARARRGALPQRLAGAPCRSGSPCCW